MNHLKLYENFENRNIIIIKADTSAVVIDELSDIQIGKLCINKAKKSSDLIDGDIYILTILQGFSSGYNMFRYNNGKITETTEEEYNEVLDNNGIKTGRDLEKFPSVNIDLYGK